MAHSKSVGWLRRERLTTSRIDKDPQSYLARAKKTWPSVWYDRKAPEAMGAAMYGYALQNSAQRSRDIKKADKQIGAKTKRHGLNLGRSWLRNRIKELLTAPSNANKKPKELFRIEHRPRGGGKPKTLLKFEHRY